MEVVLPARKECIFQQHDLGPEPAVRNPCLRETRLAAKGGTLFCNAGHDKKPSPIGSPGQGQFQ